MFEKELVNRGQFTHTYLVRNTNGMTDEQVLNACDPNNFGGRVARTEDGNGWAQVYID